MKSAWRQDVKCFSTMALLQCFQDGGIRRRSAAGPFPAREHIEPLQLWLNGFIRTMIEATEIASETSDLAPLHRHDGLATEQALALKSTLSSLIPGIM
jgi:hypothetical protein